MNFGIIRQLGVIIWIECVADTDITTFDQTNDKIIRNGSVTSLPTNESLTWELNVTDVVAAVGQEQINIERSNNPDILKQLFAV